MIYVFIINPFANKSALNEIKSTIEAFRKEKGENSVVLRFSEYAGQAFHLAKKYENKYGDKVLIVACGGDGTAHEVANALAYTKTPMCILPLGTGNDFARSILSESLRNTPKNIVSALPSASFRHIDLLRVECRDANGESIPDAGRYCLNITSFGLDTTIQFIAKKIIQKTRHNILIRKQAYNLATALAVLKGWNYKVQYSFFETGKADEEPIQGELSYILSAFCNGAYYGNGFCPSPHSRMDDGVMDVCLVEEIPLYQVLPLIPKYKKGTHNPHPNIRNYKIKKAILRATSPEATLNGNYDGEDFSGYEVGIEVRPLALPFAFFSS